MSCVTATTIREPLSTLLMFSSKGCGLSSTNVGNPIDEMKIDVKYTAQVQLQQRMAPRGPILGALCMKGGSF